MKLNQFIWNNYKESKEGQEVIKFFEEGFLDEILRKFAEEKNKDFDYYSNLICQISDLSILPENIEIEKVYSHILQNGLIGKSPENNEEYDIYFSDDLDFILSTIEPLSLSLYNFVDEESKHFYIPYLFHLNFSKLLKIADTFGIILPNVPLKKNKIERANYYLEFCKIFNDFRSENNLSIFELCAFLYDFAPNFIGKNYEVLPEPTNIWLCGGAKGDYPYLLNSNSETEYFWQGNEDAKKGDIIVMYCLSPQSSIEFICRCMNDGIRDPFFHYYGSITVGNIQTVKPIHISEIKTDEHLQKLPIVKKNLQGVNGTRLNNEDYKRILQILSEKGQDISLLPQLSSVEFLPNTDCKNERDVEIKIVEPFLYMIGYTENDWVRQLSVRMGRGERNYPDYVFFASGNKGYESGKMLLEAKFIIKSNRDLEETFQQAHSYALRLNSQIIVIADKDYIWIYSKKNESFDRTKYSKFNWQELNNPDTFNAIKKKIGKDFFI